MKSKGTFGIIIALSIATLAATIMVSYGTLQAEAKQGTTVAWCYNVVGSRDCFFEKGESHGDCIKAQESNPLTLSGCFKVKR